MQKLKLELDNLINEQITNNMHYGLQLSVYKNGKEILNHSYGKIGPNSDKNVNNKTLFLGFSITKGICNILIHCLVEDNYLEYDKPICYYWHNFKQKNKDKITVRHLLCHKSGLHRMPDNITDEMLASEDLMIKYLEHLEPVYEPGTKTMYCAFTYSWLILGLIKHSTNISFRELFNKYIIKKFNIYDEAFIGLPNDPKIIDRIADIEIFAPIPKLDSEEYKAFPPKIWSFLNKNPTWHYCLPAMNGYFTAHALAKIFSHLANNDILSPETIKTIYDCQTEEKDDVIGVPVRKGMGVFLGPTKVFGKSRISFGNYGMGGSVVFADPENNISISVLVNKLNYDYKNNPVAIICNLIRNHILDKYIPVDENLEY